MATRNSYVDQDFNKQSLLNAKIQPLTTTAKNTLAATLVAADEGLTVFDTTLNRLQVWDGASFTDAVPGVASSVVFRGVVGYDATEPSTPALGDLYIFSTAGLNTWATNSEEVQIGDQVIYTGTDWSYIQGNAVQASETVLGLVKIATQVETNAGVSDLVAVTPAKLAAYVASGATNPRPARIFKTTIASLVANTPATVTHNLAVNAASEVVVQTYQGGAQIDLVVSPTSVNAITIESNVGLSNVTVVVVG
jgi:hypothetical protein